MKKFQRKKEELKNRQDENPVNKKKRTETNDRYTNDYLTEQHTMLVKSYDKIRSKTETVQYEPDSRNMKKAK